MRVLLKTSAVAERLNVSRETVRVWCKTGKIPALKVGCHYRVPQDLLEDWVRNQVVEHELPDEEYDNF